MFVVAKSSINNVPIFANISLTIFGDHSFCACCYIWGKNLDLIKCFYHGGNWSYGLYAGQTVRHET